MKKPKRFSDPYHDWDGCETLLSSIVAKKPKDLSRDDYAIIFARHLPAADYAEGLFYLKPCLDFIGSGKEIHSSNYPDSILWWIMHFKEEMQADGHWDDTLHSIRETALKLFSSFELFNLTEDECRKLGRDFDYSIGPYNQQTVRDLIDDLLTWPEYQDVTDSIIGYLEELDNLTKARWYVELASHSRVWCLLYDEHCDSNNYTNKEAMFHRLHTFRNLQKAQEMARDATRRENHEKYYRIVRLW